MYNTVQLLIVHYSRLQHGLLHSVGGGDRLGMEYDDRGRVNRGRVGYCFARVNRGRVG